MVKDLTTIPKEQGETNSFVQVCTSIRDRFAQINTQQNDAQYWNSSISTLGFLSSLFMVIFFSRGDSGVQYEFLFPCIVLGLSTDEHCKMKIHQTLSSDPLDNFKLMEFRVRVIPSMSE